MKQKVNNNQFIEKKTLTVKHIDNFYLSMGPVGDFCEQTSLSGWKWRAYEFSAYFTLLSFCHVFKSYSRCSLGKRSGLETQSCLYPPGRNPSGSRSLSSCVGRCQGSIPLDEGMWSELMGSSAPWKAEGQPEKVLLYRWWSNNSQGFYLVVLCWITT